MIHLLSFVCGVVITIITQVILALIIWKVFNKKKKPVNERDIVKGIKERYQNG